jgi:hypothetical protein
VTDPLIVVETDLAAEPVDLARLDDAMAELLLDPGGEHGEAGPAEVTGPP